MMKAKKRMSFERLSPPCPFGCLDMYGKNIDASSKVRWKYECIDCQTSWYQKRPDLLDDDEDPAVFKAGTRSDKAYACRLCGVSPKKGHFCKVKERKTPSPALQGKIYMCRKCGVPKKGHTCIERTIASLNSNNLYDFLALGDLNACDICNQECVSTDMLDGFTHCVKCQQTAVHFTCMPDMLSDYVCSKCI